MDHVLWGMGCGNDAGSLASGRGAPAALPDPSGSVRMKMKRQRRLERAAFLLLGLAERAAFLAFGALAKLHRRAMCDP